MARVRWHVWMVVGLAAATGGCAEGTGLESQHLVFEVEPSSMGAGSSFAPVLVVGVRDPAGLPVTWWEAPVSIALEGDGRLGGIMTRRAVGGFATFEGVTVDGPGHGYRLIARSGTLQEAVSAPFDVRGPFTVSELAAGWWHTCALDDQGKAYCWGANNRGQLGDGTTDVRRVPTAVATTQRFVRLSAGQYHTCGVTGEGAVYCWGDNSLGQVGIAGSRSVLTPARVTLPGAASATAAGHVLTCASVAGGVTYCWGTVGWSTNRPPEALAGGIPLESVSVGYVHACGLGPDGAAYCWGVNSHGELGDGTTEDRSEPTAVVGGHRFRGLSAGGSSNGGETCGVAEDGRTYCWGWSYRWSSYNMLDVPVTEPVPLESDPRFGTIWVGPTIRCGGTAGMLYCWKVYPWTDTDGWFALSEMPERVLRDHQVAEVASGHEHLCFLDTDHRVWCWGSNGDGQLGNPSNPFGWKVPVPVWAPEG